MGLLPYMGICAGNECGKAKHRPRSCGLTTHWSNKSLAKAQGHWMVGGVGGGWRRGGGLRPHASRHVAETRPCDGRLFRYARCRTGPYNIV